MTAQNQAQAQAQAQSIAARALYPNKQFRASFAK
jgi:hypothetical protein